MSQVDSVGRACWAVRCQGSEVSCLVCSGKHKRAGPTGTKCVRERVADDTVRKWSGKVLLLFVSHWKNSDFYFE